MEVLPAMISPESTSCPISPISQEPIVHLPKPTPMSLATAVDHPTSFLKMPSEHATGSNAIHPTIGKSIEHMPPKKAHLLLLQAQLAQREPLPAHAAPAAGNVVQQEPVAETVAEPVPLPAEKLTAPAGATTAPVPATPSAPSAPAAPPVTSSAAASAAPHPPPQLPPVTAPAPSSLIGSTRVTFATMRDMVQAALLLQSQCTAALPAIYSFVERFGRILTKGGVERHLTAQKNWKSSIRSTLYQNNIFMRAGSEGSWQIVPTRCDERPEISFGTVSLEQLRALASTGGSDSVGVSRSSPPPSSPPQPSSAPTAPSIPPSLSAPLAEQHATPPVRAVKSETPLEPPQMRRPLIKPAAVPAGQALPERKPTVRPVPAAAKPAASATAKNPSGPSHHAVKRPLATEDDSASVMFGEKDLRAIKGLFERQSSPLGTVPLHLLVTPESWALLNESEKEHLRSLLPEPDRTDEAFQRLLRGHNISFVQYAELFGSMLRSGTFDPLLASQRAAAKRALIKDRDLWKSEHYEDVWGEQLMQTLWADYAANATAAAARSNINARQSSAVTAAETASAATGPPALAAGPALAAVMHSVGETITKIEKADNEDELVDIGDDDASPSASPTAASTTAPVPQTSAGPLTLPTLAPAAVVVAPPVPPTKKASAATQYLQDLPDDDEDEQDEPDDELWKPAPRTHHSAGDSHHHHQPRKGIAAHVLRRAGAPPSKSKKKKGKTPAGLRSPFGSTSNLLANSTKRKLSSSGPIALGTPTNSATAIPRSLLPLKKQLVVRAAVDAAAPSAFNNQQPAPVTPKKKKLAIPKPHKKQKFETPRPSASKLPPNLLRRSLQTPLPAAKKRPRSRSPSPNLPSPHIPPTFVLPAVSAVPAPPASVPLAAAPSATEHSSSLLGPPVYNSAAAARALAKEPTRRQLQALVAEDELRQLQLEAAPPVKKRRPSNISLLAGFSAREHLEASAPDTAAPAAATAAAGETPRPKHPHPHPLEGGHTAVHATPTKASQPPPLAPQPSRSLLRSSAADDEVIDIMFSDEGKTETAWT